MTATMPFGKHVGKRLQDLPTGYLRWLARECASAEPWLLRAAERELRERGERHIDINVFLDDLEEIMSERLTEDGGIPHDMAARIGDHWLDAFVELRRKYNLKEDTKLIVAARGRGEERRDVTGG